MSYTEEVARSVAQRNRIKTLIQSGSAVRHLARFCHAYSLALLMFPMPLAYSQDARPVASYKLDTRSAIKSQDGLLFHWAIAPDTSLLVAMWEVPHQWKILRLREWDTHTPKIESISIPVNLPNVELGFPPENAPLISPDGNYLVVRSPEINVGENESDKQRWETVVSVIDLKSFTVASNVTAFGGLAGGHLFFGNGGALMLHGISEMGSPLPFKVAVFALPSLDRIASCNYEATQSSVVTKTGDSCPALMEAAHLSSIQDLGDRPTADERVKHLAGAECDFERIAPAADLALYRCGKEHFAGQSGEGFSITFWHALKVLNTSDGKTVLSLPLRFNDSHSSGLFAQKKDQNYLIVHYGRKLQTYQISTH